MQHANPFLFPEQEPFPTVEVQHDGRTWVRTELPLGEWIEHLDGQAWTEHPLPRRWHRCTPSTRGYLDFRVTERCACGATRTGGRYWIFRNERRR